MKKYDAILFDFDGVIVDSFDIKNEAFKEIYKEYGLEDKVDLRQGGKSRYEKIAYFHKKLLDINLDEKELESLCKRYSDLTLKRVINAPLIEGVESFLKTNQKIDMYVVSGTPQNELEEIVKAKEMDMFFKEVHGSYDKKHNIIKKIVDENCYKNPVYIGDQISDYDNAKKAGVEFIGIGETDIFPKETKIIESFVEFYI